MKSLRSPPLSRRIQMRLLLKIIDGKYLTEGRPHQVSLSVSSRVAHSKIHIKVCERARSIYDEDNSILDVLAGAYYSWK